MSTTKLVKELKENDQDFEWYPTTDAIITRLCRELKKDSLSYFSMLDIGAGNGQTLNKIDEILEDKENNHRGIDKKYAIEKSRILINNMADDIFVIGTDFHQQTLIDKKVDVIFCNPPYSEYKKWVTKIIKEANAKYLYLVIPKGWMDYKEVIDSINLRLGKEPKIDSANYTVLDSFSFENSEYREARAKVNLVKITLCKGYDNYKATDPFDIWFNETFKIATDKEKVYSYDTERKKEENLKDLISGRNVIEALEELYNKDLQNLLNTYRQLEEIDPTIFQELDISLDSVKESLKLKIENIKNLYWRELFDNMDSITSKLTSKSRENLLGTLTENTNIDFTANNAYNIIIWAIKNANKYIDKQLLYIYLDLTKRENVINYKSNKRIIEDGWRFQAKEHTHYILDYRMIASGYCFEEKWDKEYKFKGHDTLNDICTVAKTLGFDVYSSSYNFTWIPGKKEYFYMNKYGDDKDTLFMEAKGYKNGNLHIKMNQEFMKSLNIEAARLNGWIKSPKDLCKETDIKEVEIDAYYNSIFKININKNNLLTDNTKENNGKEEI